MVAGMAVKLEVGELFVSPLSVIGIMEQLIITKYRIAIGTMILCFIFLLFQRPSCCFDVWSVDGTHITAYGFWLTGSLYKTYTLNLQSTA